MPRKSFYVGPRWTLGLLRISRSKGFVGSRVKQETMGSYVLGVETVGYIKCMFLLWWYDNHITMHCHCHTVGKLWEEYRKKINWRIYWSIMRSDTCCSAVSTRSSTMKIKLQHCLQVWEGGCYTSVSFTFNLP